MHLQVSVLAAQEETFRPWPIWSRWGNFTPGQFGGGFGGGFTPGEFGAGAFGGGGVNPMNETYYADIANVSGTWLLAPMSAGFRRTQRNIH